MNKEKLLENTEITELKENLIKYIFDPRGFKNCSYLLKGEKNILIDAGTFVDERVDVLVLTHSHYDHLIFATYIIEKNNCKVFASKEAAKHLEKLDEITLVSTAQDLIKQLTGNKLKSIKVTDFVGENSTISNKNFNLKIIETPGHSPGGIALYEERKKILFSGDTIFDGGVGRTDLPGSNGRALFASIEKLNTLKVDLLCPGHNYVNL